MKTFIHLPFTSRILTVLTSLLLVATVSSAQEKQFDQIVVFGTSLSDPGNAFALLSDPEAYGFDVDCDLGTPVNTPPYDKLVDQLLIPDGSYAIGGHHVSNGATWIEQFARAKGLSGDTRPALGNEGTASNYAVGGARAVEDYLCRFNLSDQLAAFAMDQQDGLVITKNTLFVFEIGANDVRDALVLLSIIEDQDEAKKAVEVLFTTALSNIAEAITALSYQGAEKFLLVNVPPIGETPALKMMSTPVQQVANLLTQEFNEYLGGLQALPGDIKMLDLHTLLNEIIATPESFGITNTVDACVTPNVAPFTCKDPDSYLFWDGIHPTKAVHDIMAQEAAEVLN